MRGVGRRRGPRALGVLVLLATLGLAAGCGIGAQETPSVVAHDDVPTGLVNGTPTSTFPDVVPSDYVTIYFAGRQRLVTVTRSIPEPISVEAALAALSKGPTTSEEGIGLESPISTAAPIRAVRRHGSTVTVNVGKSFSDLAGPEQVVAVAQLVYTATEFPGVGSIQLRIGGKVASVPTDKGKITSNPLTRDDFAELAPL